ncbi:hypothetical protein F1E19_25770 [Escherichia coli]|nr:hypothetical protein F1E19_25770 [Escherichia coli]
MTQSRRPSPLQRRMLIVLAALDEKRPGPVLTRDIEPRQPGGCKLKTAPVRPVVAARPAEYVCSEDLFY